MFEKIKELAMEHGIGVAIGASLVGAVWAAKNYLNKKNNFQNKLIDSQIEVAKGQIDLADKIVNSNQ